MKLTMLLVKCEDGRWRSSLAELPHIHYYDQTAGGAENKMQRLVKALASPNIQLESVYQDGEGVVLTIDRDPAEKAGTNGAAVG
jgi:hypothetical protein